jgi:hypothetical protein
MGREIQLDGVEVSVIKCLGIGSGDMDGNMLLESCRDLEFAELADALRGLMAQGYVDGESESFNDVETFKKLHFRVNSGYAKELRDALDPTPQQKQSKRVRRE